MIVRLFNKGSSLWNINAIRSIIRNGHVVYIVQQATQYQLVLTLHRRVIVMTTSIQSFLNVSQEYIETIVLFAYSVEETFLQDFLENVSRKYSIVTYSIILRGVSCLRLISRIILIKAKIFIFSNLEKAVYLMQFCQHELMSFVQNPWKIW